MSHFNLVQVMHEARELLARILQLERPA